MPAMTKEQYRKAGAKAAATGARPAALKSGTWQHRAYMEGYNAPVETRRTVVIPSGRRVGKASLQSPQVQEVLVGDATLSAALEARRQARFAHWPQAASEHLRCLAMDIAKERDPHRVERLMRAAGRMTKRYGAPRSSEEVDRMLARPNFTGTEARPAPARSASPWAGLAR